MTIRKILISLILISMVYLAGCMTTPYYGSTGYYQTTGASYGYGYGYGYQPSYYVGQTIIGGGLRYYDNGHDRHRHHSHGGHRHHQHQLGGQWNSGGRHHHHGHGGHSGGHRGGHHRR